MEYTSNLKSTRTAQALADVQSRKWIVGSLSEAGAFSIASNPVCHTTAASAEAECERLAKINPGTAYISMQFRAGRLVPKVTSVQSF